MQAPKARLPIPAAVKFLRSCRKAGVERVGFTGGEPFLDIEFLHAVTEFAVAHGFLFGLVTTNAAWFRSAARLRRTLKELFDRGYDGSFGVSVDAFHGKDPAKPALFIETARKTRRRFPRSDDESVLFLPSCVDQGSPKHLGG